MCYNKAIQEFEYAPVSLQMPFVTILARYIHYNYVIHYFIYYIDCFH